jgi:hypothetical protein
MFSRQLAARAMPAVRGQARATAARAFSATSIAREEFPTVATGQSLWNFTEEENMLRDAGEYQQGRCPGGVATSESGSCVW